MYTCQIVTDSNTCVTFEKYLSVLGPFFLKPPKYDVWWGWDMNFGDKYMVSMRQSKDCLPEYILWNSYNSTLSTGSTILSTKDLPVRHMITLLVGYFSNRVSAQWARWRLCVPLIHTVKVKRV